MPKAKSTPAQKPTNGALALPDLPPRYAAFVDEYCLHFNGTRAAIAAGYSAKSAAGTAGDILRNPQVREEISRRRHARAENMENITKERVQYELASVGLASMGDMTPMFGDGDVAEKVGNLTRTQAAAVKEIVIEEFKDGRSDWRTVRRTKFKLHDKKSSLDLLAQMNGWVTEKVDIKHHHTGTILHAMMAEIAAEEDGKPIVELEANKDDQALPVPKTVP